MKRYFYEGNEAVHPTWFYIRDTRRGSEHDYESDGIRAVAECKDRDDAEMIVELLNAMDGDR